MIKQLEFQDFSMLDTKVKYADGWQPTEEELQTIIIDKNGIRIVQDYLGNYSVDTDKYWAYFDDFHGGEIHIRNKMTNKHVFHFGLNNFCDMMKVPPIHSLTCANDIDAIFDRFFKLRAFL